jgi:hypothetical protein
MLPGVNAETGGMQEQTGMAAEPVSVVSMMVRVTMKPRMHPVARPEVVPVMIAMHSAMVVASINGTPEGMTVMEPVTVTGFNRFGHPQQ